jgi:hypothetical protein
MLLLYLWTILLAFMVLMVHLHPQLTMTELAFAAIPVGSIGGAWLFFLVSMLLNFLRCAVPVSWASVVAKGNFRLPYVSFYLKLCERKVVRLAAAVHDPANARHVAFTCFKSSRACLGTHTACFCHAPLPFAISFPSLFIFIPFCCLCQW